MAKTIEIRTIGDLVRIFTCPVCEMEIRSSSYTMVRVPGSKLERTVLGGAPLDWAMVHYKKCREIFEVWNPGEWISVGHPPLDSLWKLADGLAD